MAKTRKKVIAKKTTGTDKAKTVGVSRVTTKTVNVLGIDFEQGSDYLFGKCMPTRAPYPGDAVQTYTFVFDKAINKYVLWGGQQGGYIDTFTYTPDQFKKSYAPIDFETPMPQAMLNGDEDDDYDEDGDDY